MTGKVLWIALSIAVFGLAILAGIIYLTPPSLLVKEAQASLFLESTLALIRDGSRGVEVSVLGHSYDPSGVREFVSRTYRFVPGYTLELDARDVTSIRTKNIYFINMSKHDSISPVAAVFHVNWWVEGEGKNQSLVIARGDYDARLVESTLSHLPREFSSYTESVSGEEEVVLNLSEIDVLLAGGDEGSYTLELKGDVYYTFIPWSGHQVSNEKNFTVFTIDVSYLNGTKSRMRLYYPLNYFTEEVQITHPMLVRAKQFLLGLKY